MLRGGGARGGAFGTDGASRCFVVAISAVSSGIRISPRRSSERWLISFCRTSNAVLLGSVSGRIVVSSFVPFLSKQNLAFLIILATPRTLDFAVVRPSMIVTLYAATQAHQRQTNGMRDPAARFSKKLCTLLVNTQRSGATRHQKSNVGNINGKATALLTMLAVKAMVKAVVTRSNWPTGVLPGARSLNLP